MKKGMISCDFKKLQKYFDKISRMDKRKTEELYEASIKRLTSEIYRAVTIRTPVDTGNLRRSWCLSSIKKQGESYVAYVSSNLKYAVYVEYGHRLGETDWVNGYFMLTLSVEEVENKTPNILESVIKKKLKEMFGSDNN